jgi:hypothetical protein
MRFYRLVTSMRNVGGATTPDDFGASKTSIRAPTMASYIRSRTIQRGASTAAFMLGLITSPLAFTDACMDVNDHPNLIAGLPQNNGVTTVTYSAVGGGAVTPEAAAAFSAWNTLTSQTGVNFVPASGNNVGNVQVGYNDDEDCISTSARYGHIYYGNAFLPDINTPSYANDGKLSFEHEIGHILGLADNSGNNSDIMDQSSKCTPAEKGYSWDATAPKAADATQAKKCQNDARKCDDDT